MDRVGGHVAFVFWIHSPVKLNAISPPASAAEEKDHSLQGSGERYIERLEDGCDMSRER
jgi:hypothetical protein